MVWEACKDFEGEAKIWETISEEEEQEEEQEQEYWQFGSRFLIYFLLILIGGMCLYKW